MKIRFLLFTLAGLLLTVASSFADYQVTIPTGRLRLIGNQYNNGGNTLSELFPNPTGALDGDEIEKWNCNGFTVYVFDSASSTGFSDLGGNPVPNTTLVPGEAAFFYNATGPDLTFNFTGTPVTPVLPAFLPCGCGHTNFLSRQTDGFGTYENITGLSPQEGSEEQIWTDPGFFTVYTFTGCAWTPSDPPILAIGQGAAFYIPCETNCRPCPPQPIALFNTGVDANGLVLSNGVVDPHYALTVNPSGGGSSAYVITGNGLTNSLTSTNNLTSKWIGATANGQGLSSNYTYRITFNLPCTNYALITGQWAVDNNGAIILNGNPTPVTTLTGGGSGNFAFWHPFTISSGLVAGQNTLDFNVINIGAGPTGLRVELSGTSTCCPPPSTNCCDTCTTSNYVSYTMHIFANSNYFLANPLCHGTNNTLVDLLPNPPDFTTVYKYNGGYSAYIYDPDNPGWTGNPTINPGDGFVLNSPTDFDLTFTGCDPTCPPPCLPPATGRVLVGRRGIGTATWSDLSTCDPACGTRVAIYNGGDVVNGFDNYDYVNGAWQPPLPVLDIAQSVFVSLLANTNCTTNGCISMTCSSNKVVNCPWNGQFDTPTNIVDTCCTSYSVSLTKQTNSGPCPLIVTGTWTISDLCGNTNTCSQTITVVDTSPPVFPNCPANTNLGCNPTSIPICGGVGVADNCGGLTLSCSQVTVTNGCNRTRTITYTAKDACNNSNQCIQVITWTVDTTAPVFTNCPASTNLGCNPVSIPGCSVAVGATDNCGGGVSVSCSQVNATNGCNRTRTITYTALDACGNSNTCTQVITWTVNTNVPVIVCPTNILVNTCSNSAVVTYNVTATNSCCTNMAIGANPPSGSSFPVGTTVVSCTATDCCGNIASCTFNVTVSTNCCTNGVSSLVLNSGYDQNTGGVYGFGQADAFWWVTRDPTVPATTLPRPATVIDRHPAWKVPQAGSQWISSYATEADNLNGEYDFQSYFCATAGASNLVLNVCVRADDVVGVALNGHLLTLSGSSVFNAASPACATVVQSSGWFVLGGQNTLTLYVTNTGGVAMGVNASVSLTGTGLLPLGSACCPYGSGISGQKFYDLNCNGVQEPGEPGLPGWTIRLSNGQSATTDVNGYYYFTNLPPGSYAVSEVAKTNWTQSYPAGGTNFITLTNLQEVNGQNFGNCHTNNNCVQIFCPSNIVVLCSGPDGALVPFTVTATNLCGTNLVKVRSDPPSNTFFPVGVTTVHCTALDTSNNWAGCSFTVTVSTNCCTNGVSSLVLNSGYDQNTGGVYGFGQADAFWWVTRDPTVPATTLPRPATVIDRHPAWKVPQAGSQWISSYATEADNLNGEYDFQSYFCATAGASNLVLNVCVRADDVVGVALNGHLLTLSGSSVFNAASPACATVVQSSGWFVLGGQNTLTLYVTNTGGVAMGVNASVSLTGTGLLPLGSACCPYGSGISGQKFYDLNCNGVQEPGEPGLPGWTIRLSNGQSATTDVNGYYYFTNLPPGSYAVSEVGQTNWTQSYPAGGTNFITLTNLQEVNGQNFGNCHTSQPCVSIFCPSNIVVLCSGPDGALVPFTVTATNLCGTNLVKVRSDPPSNTFFPVGVTTVHCTALDTSNNWAGCSFTVTVSTNCCTNGVSSLVLNSGYDQNTGGVYGFGQADAFWWVTRDPTVPATTLPRPATVIDRHPAWKVPQAGSQWISSYATEADNLNGEYDFQSYFCATAGASNLVLNVCVRADDVVGVALNGHLLTLSGSSVFNAASPACATVVQSSGWFVLGGQNTLTLYVTNTGGVAMGVNASVSLTGTGLLPLGSACCPYGSGISGQKFYDLNCNGVQEPGEPGLPGWTIRLSNGQSATTDVNGYYYFTNLPPGSYAVSEVGQTNWTQSYPAGGTNFITLTNLQEVNGQNFGNCHTNNNCVSIFCPSNIVVLCSGPDGALVPFTVTATNLCGTNLVKVRSDPPSNTFFPVGVTTVHCTALDTSNNWAGCSFTVTVSTNCCTNGVSSLVLNSGYDQNTGGVYGFGQADAFWWVTRDPTVPATTLPRPATVIDRHPAWKVPQAGSQWISSYATEADNLNGEYDFQSYFCATAGASNLVLNVCVRADDVVGVALNGHLLTLSGSSVFNAASPACATVVQSSGWFVLGGQNTLTLYVTNTGGVAMGVNASVSLTGTGLLPLGSACCPYGSGISGQKFYDLNCNGVQEPGEPGLPGWTIRLSNGQSATTDVNGYYYFTNLPPGSYAVSEVGQTNWTQSYPAGGTNFITLTNLQEVNGQNFGNCHTNNNCVSIFCPSNIVVLCSGPDGALVPFTVTATNLCGTNLVKVRSDPPSNTFFPVGVTTVHCTALDTSNNWAGCSFTVTVSTNCCTNGVSSLVLNSGYDQNTGGVYGFGQADAFWWVTRDPTVPATTLPRPATVIDRHPAWKVPQAGSQWISSYATEADNLNGEYDFQSYFCATAGASNLVLNVCVRADDVVGVALNGHLLTLSGSSVFNAASPACATVVQSSGWFVLGGQNTLTLYVTNTGGVAMGVNASVSLTGTGLLPLGSACCPYGSGISGQKFYDLNCNGVQEPGEPGLPGWTIRLSNGQSATTDVNGYYYFTNLPPGSYAVSEVGQTNWTQSYPAGGTNFITLTNLQEVNGQNFGNCHTNNNCVSIFCPSNIVVLCSGPDGALVPFTVTATNLCGTNLVKVRSDPPSNTFFPVGVTTVHCTALDTSNNWAGCSFTVTVSTNCCTNGVSSLVLNSGYDQNTGGVYGFGQADAFWWVTRDPTVPATTLPRPATVIDRHPAWKVPQAGSQWISSYATEADNLNGEYDFQSYFCATAGASNLVLNVCVRADDVVGVALNGHLLTLSGSSVFNAASPACATVVQSSGWFVLGGQNTLTLYVTNTGGVAMGVNASVSLTGTGLLPLGSACCPYGSGISGQKFYDLNCNGVQEPGEPGLPGWTIRLSNGQSATTDVNGYYYFTNLPPGSYAVSEAAKTNWTQSYPAGGTNFITLTNLQEVNGQNFGNCHTNNNCVSIFCPSNIVVLCSGPDGALVPFTVTATNLCGTNLVKVRSDPPSNTFFPVGVTTVHCTALDTSNNWAGCSFTVTVQPGSLQVVCPTNKIVLCGTAWSFDTPTATSCCGSNVSIIPTGTTTNGGCVQYISKSWLITDACGNSAVCTQVVTVVKSWPPIFTPGISLDYATEPKGGISFAGGGFTFVGDTNGIQFEVDNVFGGAGDSLGFEGYISSSAPFAIGSITISGQVQTAPVTGSGTFHITDGVNEFTGTIQWLDIATLGTSGVLNLNGLVNLSGLAYAGGSLDLQSLTASITAEVNLTFQFIPGRTLTQLKNTGGFTDFSGTIVGSPVITTPPLIACVGDKTVACGTAWTFDPPVSTSGCCSNLTIIPLFTQTNGTGCALSISKAWKAIDCCSNSIICTQTVSVLPAAQILLCPSNIVVITCSTNVPVTWSVTATNPCSPVTVTSSPPSGTVFHRDTTNTVNVTATDAFCHTNSCTFQVIVRKPLLIISIGSVPGTITVSWLDGGILQQADNVVGPYTDMPTASSPYTTAPTAPQKFYRLRCP